MIYHLHAFPPRFARLQVAFSQIFEESVQLLLPRVATLDAQSVANAPCADRTEGLRHPEQVTLDGDGWFLMFFNPGTGALK